MDPNFIYHHLNVNPSVTSKKQPPRHSSKDHSDAIKDDVIKLKQAGAIKEVFYPEWLANAVVVKKKNGPRIDQLVDATIGHPRMSFLDAFQGYHQIPLALGNQE